MRSLNNTKLLDLRFLYVFMYLDNNLRPIVSSSASQCVKKLRSNGNAIFRYSTSSITLRRAARTYPCKMSNVLSNNFCLTSGITCISHDQATNSFVHDVLTGHFSDLTVIPDNQISDRSVLLFKKNFNYRILCRFPRKCLGL